MAYPRRKDPVGLGVWPDAAVAASEGISPQAVAALRARRGIPAPSKRERQALSDGAPKKVADGK